MGSDHQRDRLGQQPARHERQYQRRGPVQPLRVINHAQQGLLLRRDLLAGDDITVPAALTPAQVQQLTGAQDPRLAVAANAAKEDGQVIQFLAGAPELLARYRNAPPAARVLIDTAMDARRLGMGAGLPQAFLEAAAPGYLTDDQWDGLGEDWLGQALAYAAVPCNGARGPLTRIRPRPSAFRTRKSGPGADSGQPEGSPSGPLYRLADYLDQLGRAERESKLPPPSFWARLAITSRLPPCPVSRRGRAHAGCTGSRQCCSRIPCATASRAALPNC